MCIYIYIQMPRAICKLYIYTYICNLGVIPFWCGEYTYVFLYIYIYEYFSFVWLQSLTHQLNLGRFSTFCRMAPEPYYASAPGPCRPRGPSQCESHGFYGPETHRCLPGNLVGPGTQYDPEVVSLERVGGPLRAGA